MKQEYWRMTRGVLEGYYILEGEVETASKNTKNCKTTEIVQLLTSFENSGVKEIIWKRMGW